MAFSHRIGRWVDRVDRAHARAVQRWYRMSPFDRPWMIVPYLGFGTPRRFEVSGRVLRRMQHREPEADDSAWRNFAEFWKRMESDELPGARVRVAFGGTVVETVADQEGHFDTTLELAVEVSPGWHSVALELLDPAPREGAGVAAQADVLVPAHTARFGVISDIDDTIVWSNVTRKLRMLSMLMRSNARIRKPFKGVAAFYRALHEGASGDARNPVFYVSSSPWNLYIPLVDFLQFQQLPRGPLMLRDFGDHLLFRGVEAHAHKRRRIEKVFETYPDVPFVLIGDSGERDPEIYAELVGAHSGRVRTIYIRNVTPDPARVAAVEELATQVHRSGAELVLVADSEGAAVHAAARGYIDAASLAQIRGDVERDSRPGPARGQATVDADV